MRGSSEGDLAPQSGDAHDLSGGAAVPGGTGAVAVGSVRGADVAAVLVLEAAQASGAGFAADLPASHHGAIAGAAGRGVQVFSNEDNEE